MDPDSGAHRDLAFFVDVVTKGSVLGVDATHSPDEVSARLGTDFADNRSGAHMWRDYGAIEFFWEQPPGTSEWRGTHFSIQVHRLSKDPEWINDAVRRTYGGFRRRLRFQELAEALAEAGCKLTSVARPALEVREFAYPATGVSVLVATAAADIGLDAGEVWQINCQNSLTLERIPNS